MFWFFKEKTPRHQKITKKITNTNNFLKKYFYHKQHERKFLFWRKNKRIFRKSLKRKRSQSRSRNTILLRRIRIRKRVVHKQLHIHKNICYRIFNRLHNKSVHKPKIRAEPNTRTNIYKKSRRRMGRRATKKIRMEHRISFITDHVFFTRSLRRKRNNKPRNMLFLSNTAVF